MLIAITLLGASMKKWDKLASPIKNELTRPYYERIKSKWFYRFVKRSFDIFASFLLLNILLFPSLIIALAIVIDSRGGIFFCQSRIGRYGKPFYIIKFRTMKKNSEGNEQITYKDDSRITKVGKFLRKTHIDEFPQLLNVICGQMSFVGTRPEVKRYVDLYTDEWNATLLMRPGITSTASYKCDDEANFMDNENAHEVYLNKILPYKMEFNLEDINKMSIFRDIAILWKTVF